MPTGEKWVVESWNGSDWVIAPGTAATDYGNAVRLARYLTAANGTEHRTRKLYGQAYTSDK